MVLNKINISLGYPSPVEPYSAESGLNTKFHFISFISVSQPLPKQSTNKFTLARLIDSIYLSLNIDYHPLVPKPQQWYHDALPSTYHQLSLLWSMFHPAFILLAKVVPYPANSVLLVSGFMLHPILFFWFKIISFNSAYGKTKLNNNNKQFRLKCPLLLLYKAITWLLLMVILLLHLILLHCNDTTRIGTCVTRDGISSE